jgi:release factor glutamine methyltransferase
MISINQARQLSPSLGREILSLLVFVCQRDLSWLMTHPEYYLSAKQERLFRTKYKKLEQGFPLAYLCNNQNFYNYRFAVSPAVLIPRPESEIIVEEGLKYAKQHKDKKISFLDVGTGSGALIISLASELRKENKNLYRKSNFLAGDISAPSLKVATVNSRRYRLTKKIIFRRGDLLQPFATDLRLMPEMLFISANLPYLTPSEAWNEKSISYEPKLALIGGKDGLSLYRQLLKSLKKILSKDQKFTLIMEINPKQSVVLSAFIMRIFSSINIKKVPDLNGRTRFLKISR